MEGLPQIIIPRILSCLEVKAACRCACISRAWAFATQHDPIARKVCTQQNPKISRLDDVIHDYIEACNPKTMVEEVFSCVFYPIFSRLFSGSEHIISYLYCKNILYNEREMNISKSWN